MSTKTLSEVDAYILQFPPEVQSKLQEFRRAIKQAAPKAEEVISYGILTFKYNGNLVHVGGFKHHIGFFPTPSAITEFSTELEKFKLSKGTVQFPFTEPLPLGLIKKIVKFRVKQNEENKKK